MDGAGTRGGSKRYESKVRRVWCFQSSQRSVTAFLMVSAGVHGFVYPPEGDSQMLSHQVPLPPPFTYLDVWFFRHQCDYYAYISGYGIDEGLFMVVKWGEGGVDSAHSE